MSVPSVETKIIEAIRARVALLPMIASYPIVWMTDTTYTPNPDDAFLRCSWSPNQTQRMVIDSDGPHQRLGVLQIDVMGRKTQAAGVTNEVAGQVAAHFPADLIMHFMGVSVRVLKAPSVGSAFVGTHMQVPVIVELESFS